MKVIADLDELDRHLVRLEDARRISDAKLREEFDGFCMEFSAPKAEDPDSDEYRNEQFAIYEKIAGKTYSTANEVTSFDPITSADVPFPYVTQGWQVIGDHLMGIGFIIKCMELKAGSSVLEFGPGWGNTSIALARSGYDVTCIEIEKNFVALIEERARRKSLSLRVIQGDFLDAANLGRKFDALLFFECFHHCARHNDLLDILDDLVNPGGIVVFAAEPITDAFHAPWGIRSDGQTLWAIRNFGWLELGFTETYFRKSLNRRGWAVERRHCPDTSIGTVYIAKRETETKRKTERYPTTLKILRGLHRRLAALISRLGS
ncbi:class I SAM-dependent methyltransferase [Tardiphaga sp. 839_C3_N1_4]|uniref:class I SAM-dependent methyltransferase n=1 Tax=Tardiphaga sp. 839_C3_N1_4 TaxID=3240761 RepID=UPI003F27C22D